MTSDECVRSCVTRVVCDENTWRHAWRRHAWRSGSFSDARCAVTASAMADEHVLVEVSDPSNDEHGTPTDGMECMATMEDITIEDKNYVEYQTAPSMRWQPSQYSSDVVKRLINTQFPEFLAGVRKADCEADLKRRLAKGPPVWVEDKHALPIPEGDTHVCRIWLAEDGKEYSAKLKGCKEVCKRGYCH